MEDVKLRGCPLCGGEANLCHSTTEIDDYWSVTCRTCLADAFVDVAEGGRDAVVAKWNTRPGEAELVETLKAVEIAPPCRGRHCPSCGGREALGHRSDCTLAALLARHTGEKR